MRLDKFLKVSRIIKRRTVANDACDASHVSVNGRSAKASYDVKEGDEITVSFGARTLCVRVKSLKESVRKEDAVNMYEVISQS
jgi:ribosomal 50S subunit-recycling heat shock protein